MITIAIDLGSVRCGMVAGIAAPTLTRAAPIDVDAANLAPAVSEIMRRVRATMADGPVRVVMEHGALYMPHDATPQQARAMAVAWSACDNLRQRIDEACTAEGVPIVTRTGADKVVHRSVPRQTWAHRLVPHHQGGISQAQVRAAVRANLDAASLDLIRRASEDYRNDDDAIDAAGVWLWAVLPPLPKPRRIRRRRQGEPRPMGVKRPAWQKLMRLRERVRKHRGLPSQAVRDDAGCICWGKHMAGCALRKPPRVRGLTADGLERARTALDGFMPRRAR